MRTRTSTCLALTAAAVMAGVASGVPAQADARTATMPSQKPTVNVTAGKTLTFRFGAPRAGTCKITGALQGTAKVREAGSVVTVKATTSRKVRRGRYQVKAACPGRTTRAQVIVRGGRRSGRA